MGEAEMAGVVAALLPVNVKLCGLPAAESVTVTVPPCAPVVVAEKLTDNAHWFPGLIVPVQPAALKPVLGARLDTVTGCVPVLIRYSVCTGEVVAVLTLPKSMLAGESARVMLAASPLP